ITITAAAITALCEKGIPRLFGVDRPASCEAFFQPVPERNVVLAEPPAEQDLLALAPRRKVDEPLVEVLDDRAAPVDLVHAARNSDPLALDFGLDVCQPLRVDTSAVASDLRGELLPLCV